MPIELKKLFDSVAAIPDDKIEEPDLDVGPTHHVVGKIDDIELRRLFTGYSKRVKELDRLHQLVKGPMLVAGNIPSAVRARMMELQDEIDLLRTCFFYVLGKRFQLFEKNFIHVHKGWLVSWSNQQLPCAVFPNLGSGKDDDDDEDDDSDSS